MIRTVLASPWFPLLQWLAAPIVVLLVAQHKSLKSGYRKHDLNPFAKASFTPEVYGDISLRDVKSKEGGCGTRRLDEP